MTRAEKIEGALLVMVLTPEIRTFLETSYPGALVQATEAILGGDRDLRPMAPPTVDLAPGIRVPIGVRDEIGSLLTDGQPVQAIKLIRKIAGIGLGAAKDVIDALPEYQEYKNRVAAKIY